MSDIEAKICFKEGSKWRTVMLPVEEYCDVVATGKLDGLPIAAIQVGYLTKDFIIARNYEDCQHWRVTQ